MQLFGITDRGCVRAENQDSYRFTQAEDLSWSVAVLCDGMGGVHGGRTASELAVSLFIQAAVEELEADTEDSLPALVRFAADAANRPAPTMKLRREESSVLHFALLAFALLGCEVRRV